MHVEPVPEEKGLAFDRAFVRVQERMERGEPQPERLLGAERGVAPRLVCLDTNKWIDLARAHYGDSKGKRFQDVLAWLRSEVDSGRCVVPVTFTNGIEFGLADQRDRRERLARFAVELSQNTFLRDEDEGFEDEFLAMLGKRGLVDFPNVEIRSRLLCYGSPQMHGRSLDSLEEPYPGFRELFKAALCEPEYSAQALANVMSRRGKDAVVELERGAKAELEQTSRATPNITLQQRAERDAQQLFLSRGDANRFRAIAARCWRALGTYDQWLAMEDYLALALEHPQVWVQMQLVLAVHREKTYVYKGNDPRDFSFLSASVPYADVVVTEAKWCEYLRRAGVGSRFGTSMVSDVRELPKVLG